ncbi:MAG TPA: hypothetical protein VN887_16455 [Candidatus Angelobacter sp.]|nr:hypothetical protein [Candidatus Angelobacter sp.]
MNDRLTTFKSLIQTSDLPGLGPTPRTGRLPLLELNGKIERFLADAKLPAALHASIRSAALLWHDYLDESHAISQDIHTADGSFLHGIMHRREPDYSNAKYWFRRVGEHDCFADLARQATRRLEADGEMELAAKLAPRGEWDPFAFVDACAQATNLPSLRPVIPTLVAVQEIEFDCLMRHLLAT